MRKYGALALVACIAVAVAGLQPLPTAAGPAAYAVTLVAVPAWAGSVAISPEADSYENGATVTVAATAAAGWAFAGWSGYLSGSVNPKSFTMPAGNVSVTANFVEVNVVEHGPADFAAGALEGGVVRENAGVEIGMTIEWPDTDVPATPYAGMALAYAQGGLYFMNGSEMFWSYDPVAKGEWVRRDSLGVNVDAGGALAYGGNNRIFALDGENGFWAYDVAADNWSRRKDIPVDVVGGASLAWDENNYVYAFSGNDNTLWRYSISDNAWDASPAACPLWARSGASLVWTGGNALYAVVGGSSRALFRYDAGDNAWSGAHELRDAPEGVTYGGSLTWGGGDHLYLVVGGGGPRFYRYYIPHDWWDRMPDLPGGLPVGDVGGHLSSDGRYVYCVPGGDSTDLLRYDSQLEEWVTPANMPEMSFYGSTVVGAGEDVYGMLRWNYGRSLDDNWRDFYLGSVKENVAVSVAGDNMTLSFNWATMAPTLGPPRGLVWTGDDNVWAENGTHLIRYSISENSWASVSALPLAAGTGGYNTLVWNGADNLYCITGAAAGQPLWTYGMSAGTWSALASPGAGAYVRALEKGQGDELYAIVENASGYHIFRYDIGENTWAPKYANMLDYLDYPSFGGGCDIIPAGGENVYYITRGANHSRYNSLMFNATDNVLTVLRAVPSAVNAGGCLISSGGGHLYATLGVHEENVYHNSLWRYSISTGYWDFVYTMPGNIGGGVQFGAYGGGAAMVWNGIDNTILATRGGTTAFWKIDPTHYAPSGTFISNDHNAGRLPVIYDKLDWTAAKPGATNVKLQFGTENFGVENYTGGVIFRGPNGGTGTYYESSGAGIWAGHTDNATFSYKVSLTGSTTETPTINFVAAGWGPAGGLYRYRTPMGPWTQVSHAPENVRTDGGVAMAYDNNDYIYVLGGSIYGWERYHFWRYSVSDNMWETLENTTYRQGPGAALTYVKKDNGYVYAFMGGYEDSAHRPDGKMFLRYDVGGGSWEDMDNVPGGVDDGGSLAWAGGDHIYAFRGAYVGTNTSRDFLRYSIPENAWGFLENLPEYVDDGGSLAWDGGHHIYALSGSNAQAGLDPDPARDFWRYDLDEGRWENMGYIPAGVGFYTANRLAVAGGGVYVYRGYGTRDFWRCIVRFGTSATYTSPAYNSAGAPAGDIVHTYTTTDNAFGDNAMASWTRENTGVARISHDNANGLAVVAASGAGVGAATISQGLPINVYNGVVSAVASASWRVENADNLTSENIRVVLTSPDNVDHTLGQSLGENDTTGWTTYAVNVANLITTGGTYTLKLITELEATGASVATVWDNAVLGISTRERENVGPIVAWGNVSWSATERGESMCRISIRLSDDLSTWTDWIAVHNGENVGRCSRYLMYKADLLPDQDLNETPTLRRITLGFSQIVAGVPALRSPPDGAMIADVAPFLSWAPAANAVAYEVQYSTSPAFTTATSVGTENTTIRPVNALSDGTWYWRVRAVDVNDNYGGWSEVRSLVVDTSTPSAPVLTVPSGALSCSGSAVLTWAHVQDPSGVVYAIQVDDSDTFSSPIEDTSGVTLTTLTVDLDADGTYYWRVMATDLFGNSSGWSQARMFRVNTSPPAMVTGTGATMRENEVVLSWEAVEGAAAYKVQISDASGAVRRERELENATTFSTDLPPGTYSWVIAARGPLDAGYGAWSQPRAFEVEALPGAGAELVALVTVVAAAAVALIALRRKRPAALARLAFWRRFGRGEKAPPAPPPPKREEAVKRPGTLRRFIGVLAFWRALRRKKVESPAPPIVPEAPKVAKGGAEEPAIKEIADEFGVPEEATTEEGSGAAEEKSEREPTRR